MKHIILASSSPRRKELLEQIGIGFEVRTSGAEEVTQATESEDIAQELSKIKAQAALIKSDEAQRNIGGEEFLIGTSSDTYDADYIKWSRYAHSIDSEGVRVNKKDITFLGNPVYGHEDKNNLSLIIGGETYKERAENIKKILSLMEADGDYGSFYADLADKMSEYDELAKQVAANEALLAAATETTTKKTEENTETKNNNIKTTEELTDSTADLIKNLDELASAYAEQGKNGNISYDTMLKLIDAGYTQCISLDNETGKIKLNTEAYKELAKAKLASQIAEYDAKIAESDDYQKKYDEAFKANDAAGMAKYSKLLISAEIEGDTDKLKRDALKAMYDNFDTYMEAGSFSGSGSSSSSSSSDNEFKKASEAYKTEADKKIALIKRELEAKKELRDATIKAIDDEIEARKRLNEDNDLEKQINEVKAQLKYGQLDEFSREQMEKKLQGLYDDKAEKEWQRNAQARKDAANAKYESEQKNYNNQISSINESLKTVQQIMSAMADGSKTVESIVNNDNTRNNTANVNLIGTALTMAQITKAVKDALMDDIVIR